MKWNVYTYTLAVCALITTLLTIKARSGSGNKAPLSKEFRHFQKVFLAIYLISMAADWLQGPYVYALYASYGFTKHDIAVLFVGGFGASMVFGTFVGAAADKMGRKRACQLYCVLYILSCVTKHARDYWMLMLGRVLGGVATSLLFSSFESWMVCEHNARGHESAALSDTFSLMYFGNSLAAIGAGMVAEGAADMKPLTQFSGIWHYGGYCSPFDLSATCLVVALVLITSQWTENYGTTGASAEQGCAAALEVPLKQMRASPPILLAGAVVSLFEGSMYIFVFNWTPGLSASQPTTPPFGLIFATFMVACMGGSSLFAVLSERMSPQAILRYAFMVATFALAMPMFATSTLSLLVSFLLFEACVGLYWPAIGTVKSQVVPEETRATIYNMYRVPLNGVVLAVLLNHMEATTAFFYCSCMLGVAFVCQTVLIGRMRSAPVARDQYVKTGTDSDDNGAGLLSRDDY